MKSKIVLNYIGHPFTKVCWSAVYDVNVTLLIYQAHLLQNVMSSAQLCSNALDKGWLEIQCSTFITLYLGSIGMTHAISDCVTNGQFYKGIIGK